MINLEIARLIRTEYVAYTICELWMYAGNSAGGNENVIKIAQALL